MVVAPRSPACQGSVALGCLCALAAACDDASVPQPTGPVAEGPIALAPGQTLGGPSRPLDKSDGPRFSGIAVVHGLEQGAGCSSSFVVPSKLDPNHDGPAYLFTAGHCAMSLGDDTEANSIVVAKALDPASTQVGFRYFADSPDAAVYVQAKRIAFATMKGADLAIVELLPSRHELRAMGVVPFVLAERAPSPGDEIAWAGHSYLLPAITSACRLAATAGLVLEHKWHWYDVAAFACLDVADGASGSPVFARDTGHVIAVQNTVAEPLLGFSPCQLDHPCAVTANGTGFVEGTDYAMPVVGLADCFEGDGRFDHTLPACPLDRGIQMQPASGAFLGFEAQPGTALTVNLELRANGLDHYRQRVVAAGSDDCRGTMGYSPVLSLANAPIATPMIPGDPGEYLLCIQAGSGPDPTAPGWQAPTQPTVVVLSVHTGPGSR